MKLSNSFILKNLSFNSSDTNKNKDNNLIEKEEYSNEENNINLQYATSGEDILALYNQVFFASLLNNKI